jgi:mono/diheme cytochrome c family protein
MYYSRAYETYAYNSNDAYKHLKERGINYTSMPVPGTVARGQVYNYHLTADSAGMRAADALVNPFDSITANKSVLAEGERLYLVNCGICHGSKLDGNGPLFNGGNGPYPAAPKNLVAPDSKAFTDGHFYHVITFGKGVMGSYASQLHPEQRWWIIEYIRSKQGGGTVNSDSTAAKTTDSTATAKK